MHHIFTTLFLFVSIIFTPTLGQAQQFSKRVDVTMPSGTSTFVRGSEWVDSGQQICLWNHGLFEVEGFDATICGMDQYTPGDPVTCDISDVNYHIAEVDARYNDVSRAMAPVNPNGSFSLDTWFPINRPETETCFDLWFRVTNVATEGGDADTYGVQLTTPDDFYIVRQANGNGIQPHQIHLVHRYQGKVNGNFATTTTVYNHGELTMGFEGPAAYEFCAGEIEELAAEYYVETILEPFRGGNLTFLVDQSEEVIAHVTISYYDENGVMRSHTSLVANDMVQFTGLEVAAVLDYSRTIRVYVDINQWIANNATFAIGLDTSGIQFTGQYSGQVLTEAAPGSVLWSNTHTVTP